MDEERKESYRSPAYTKEEINALVNIIGQYKSIILNKSTSAVASHAKDTAWNTITKVFNTQGFKHPRNVDSIKTKWENIKKEARKLAKNLINVQYSENDLYSRVVTMLLENEKADNIILTKPSFETEINELHERDTTSASVMDFNECADKESDGSDGDVEMGRSNRSLNFSPQECSLLLRCVREEKSDIFIKETTSKANLSKNSAWTRIANSFNKKSPRRRSSKVLRTKFTNMKRTAKSVNLKQLLLGKHHERLDDTNEEIKIEPIFDNQSNIDINEESVNGEVADSDDHNNSNRNNISNIDPLDIVINGNGEIGPMHQFDPWNSSYSKEVGSLKQELLNYQMETAKMERKRVEYAIQAEDAALESKALERSLRLRAARLEAIAAEMKFPSKHPALQYTYEEKRAQEYLEPFN